MTTISLLNNQDSFLENEMDVLSDLTDEQIQATGVDLRYMPKEQVNLDQIFGESTISNFKAGFVIEMRIEQISNFNGDNEMFSKFGLTHNDDTTLLVSSRRFKAEGREFSMVKPLEGDLIYMPFSNTLWVIKKVKNDPNYFQFGVNRTWRLECILYTPSHENLGDAVTPEAMGQTSQPTDESGLNFLLGITPDSAQDESELFTTKTTEQSIQTDFDSDNPFGD